MDHHMEAPGRMEVMVDPSGKRHWPDAFKERVVVEAQVAGMAVNEVARNPTRGPTGR